jgi:hypothetical protein
VREFSAVWPVVDRPQSGWVGGEEPHEAAECISKCITALGSDTSDEAAAALSRLAQLQTSYSDQIKHVRASQRRAQLDSKYQTPSFAEVKSCLSGGLPGTVDDLKALTLDKLAFIQEYLRDGDTGAWGMFWDGGKPLKEERCRDRLLDYLRLKLSSQVAINAESRMPDQNRVDILVEYDGKAVPIEIKGQWHLDVWNAASVQLEQKYTRDWRADGRGIYLVLWFGNFPGKQLPRHPDNLAMPSSPDELRNMLAARLTAGERARIDVVILDVSKSYRA